MQIGTDIIEISRIEKACRKHKRFLHRFFTKDELPANREYPGFYAHVAGKYAAKEAVAKALGSGFRGFKWHDIEILNDNLGRPYALLKGNALDLLKDRGFKDVIVTISHCDEYAVAFAIVKRQ